MEKDNTQKELFEFDQPRRQPKRFSQLFQKADFAVSLSAEKLVFVSIGIIMLMVVSFALGVERGKVVSEGFAGSEPMVNSPKAVVQPRVAPVAPVQQTVVPKAAGTTANVTSKEKAPPQTVDDKGKPYTIVVAAFSKEAGAVTEVSRLKAGGIDGFVYHSEPYYLACVGAFANKDSAQKMLTKVRQTHRDAYVKLK
jgi:cell division septation protein DedD